MELKKAIERVAKVCPKKKELEGFKAIRFLPASNGGPPHLYATDGLRLALVRVDMDDLPNLLLPSDPLVTAAKDPGELEIVETGYGKIEIRADGRSVYQLRGMDFANYPGIPQAPANFTPIAEGDWKAVAKAFHAAARETVERGLAVVHFTPDYVEATDSARMVRVDVPGPWAGLVPASIFKTWPKGEVFTAFSKTHAFFWIEDELRIVVLATNDKYPQTANTLPAEHEGPYVLASTKSFSSAVCQGMKLSDLGLVLLEMGTDTPSLKVRAWQEKVFDPATGGSTRERPGYEADVRVYGGELPEPGAAQGTMLITGKYLGEALKQVDTPNVKVGYGAMADPLRIESGVYTACVWAMVYS